MKLHSASVLLFCTAVQALSASAARWDGGRLLVEVDWKKELRVEDNLAWLRAGKVPDYAVGNVMKWLELKGVDCSEFRARYRVKEPGLGEPLLRRGDFRLGYMLDVSRCKVPKLSTLKRIAGALASFGYNELQLYVEVPFAYTRHPEMGRGWSPLTPDDIRELEAYCWTRGIMLVPNQNSFGHMEKLFRVERYRRLADVPEGRFSIEWPALKNWPSAALCPSDPQVLAFLGELYDELLPLFPHADRINVGCDEVWDIFASNSRSAARVAAVGVERVYTDHLEDVGRLCSKRDRRVLFWADMALLNFELLDEIPRTMIPVNWGYSGEEPDCRGYTCEFEGRCIALRRRGFDFYVAPSVNTWGSFFGRYATMRANLDMVVPAARKYGACGMLLTSWGDGGHRNTWLVDLPGIVYTAAKARGEEMSDAAVAAAVDRFAGARVGEALIALGRVDERKPSAAGVTAARAALAKADLRGAPPWVVNAFDTLRLGADVLEARVTGTLAAKKAGFAERFRRTWLFDNREGGLDEALRVHLKFID